ncbi:hypothetical protein [Clostridium tarantellae]|uniref:Uncharacterized protein n=1 Tax=Clostridium tarantellae TaxID=39493 RepID=A0A6I1MQW2_9CLOT|nr:hypothetical protein [Clostridium tarantellae]MPQ44557.1 hypothetical protein [Clostridium tarantellae]
MELKTELGEHLWRYFSDIMYIFKKNIHSLFIIASIFSLITVLFSNNEAISIMLQIIFVILFPIIVTCISHDTLNNEKKIWIEYLEDVFLNRSFCILMFFFITFIVAFLEVINMPLANIIKYFLWPIIPFLAISNQDFFEAIKSSCLITSKDIILSVIKYILIYSITFLILQVFLFVVDLIANNFIGSIVWNIRQFILLTSSLTASSFIYIGAVVFYKDKGW